MAKVDYTYQSNAHIQRVAKYQQMLERFFDDATSEFCKLFGKAKYDDSSQFFFEDYPTLKKKADSVVNSLSSSIYDVILTGTSAEWRKSNEITDQMVRDLFKSRGVDIDAIKNSDVVDLFNNHDKALEAFQKRKIKGLSLSDKVWNMAEYHRLETQLALSIESGESAAELARKVKKCLKEPDKLFRRVRDKYGELKLSKNAKAYHPGAGAYRSSVRNAQRLARTEINMAYREAEMQRYQDLDFIVGFEVKRSTHPYPCDICESHKGKYPKDFKFNGWHPNCRCYVIPILNTQEEFDKQSDSILRGKQYARKSVNTVTAPPEGFNQWIFDNKARILRAKKIGTLPYYMKDNSVYINRALYPPKPKVVKTIEERMADVGYRTIDEMNDMLHPVAAKAWTDSSEEMRDAAFSYTQYEGPFNRPMRRGDPDSSNVKALTEYIDKQEVPNDVWVVRGVDADANMTGIDLTGASAGLLDSIIGLEMTDKAFVSCGVTEGRGFVGHRELIFKIFVPKGTKGAYCEPFSEFGNGMRRKWDGVKKVQTPNQEAEILLQRDLKYKVTAARRLPPTMRFPDGQIEITCYIVEN